MSGVVLFMPSASRCAAYAGRLLQVIRQLEEIDHALVEDGFREEAGSVATVIADLHWQIEEILVAETTRRRDEPTRLGSKEARA